MYKLFVQGIVQGVGFRPYIYRKAVEHGLVGSVKNTGNGVEIIINDKDFIKKLSDLPPLAKISHSTVRPYRGKERFSEFIIKKSTESKGETLLPADIFMCEDCLKELKDENNRRYNYYFITCTNCGPRFSMIEDYPYDRPLTSMKTFSMCPECKKEYTDPLDRRYHAQTIACKKCGPKLRFIDNGVEKSGRTDMETIRSAVEKIKNGFPIAIKGVGGFHLCSLVSDTAVHSVRTLLHRPNKPFAIMVKDIQMAQKYAILSPLEIKVLMGPQRPIVVAKKKNEEDLKGVSELNSIGVMAPYTALHYLLIDEIREPLLMTSCNIPGEPVSLTEKMGEYFLTHDRDIVNRCDDSVLKIIADKAHFLRRSRGYTPLPLELPLDCKDTIAVGAELNNVICTAKKYHCFLSQYIGQTSHLETFEFLKKTVDRFIRLSRLNPKIIACDLHPQYNSTLYAQELSEKYNVPLVQIQHHKAHLASVAAEYDLSNYIGIAIDGLGYGEDGSIWGGEIFSVKNKTDFSRIGHLEVQPQLGGDQATVHPKRMLFGILSKFLDADDIQTYGLFEAPEIEIFCSMLDEQFNIPLTSSAGRILDAASAFLNLCDVRTYDGRPAMLLESFASTPYPFKPRFEEKNGKMVLLTTPLFEFLWENREKDKRKLAATVQMYLAEGLFSIACEQREEDDTPIVASGGVVYNTMIAEHFMRNGVLLNKGIPCGDGGICLGQAYLANLIDRLSNEL